VRLLIIEDEKRLAENIAQALREAGFAVDHAADGITGAHMAVQDIFDAIILDLMLPGKSGKRVLTELRQTKSRTPVLVLTALEGKETIVDLLNSGADDYLAKPFDLGELLARVKALIRRAKGVSSTIIQVADMEIDTVRQTVKRRGQEIDLSPMEYRILQYLSYRPRAIVSKQELLEHLYDFEWEHHSNVIEAHISNLRRKLNLQGTEPLIETLRHRGYRLSEEASS